MIKKSLHPCIAFAIAGFLSSSAFAGGTPEHYLDFFVSSDFVGPADLGLNTAVEQTFGDPLLAPIQIDGPVDDGTITGQFEFICDGGDCSGITHADLAGQFDIRWGLLELTGPDPTSSPFAFVPIPVTANDGSTLFQSDLANEGIVNINEVGNSLFTTFEFNLEKLAPDDFNIGTSEDTGITLEVGKSYVFYALSITEGNFGGVTQLPDIEIFPGGPSGRKVLVGSAIGNINNPSNQLHSTNSPPVGFDYASLGTGSLDYATSVPFTIAPEPATLAIFVCGGLALVRRKK